LCRWKFGDQKRENWDIHVDAGDLSETNVLQVKAMRATKTPYSDSLPGYTVQYAGERGRSSLEGVQ
jgi:hypothetical protein